MNHPVSQQLNAIHAMLAAGHRNLRVERHSLVLWGLAGGILFLLSEVILTAQDYPDPSRRAFAWLALLATVLGAVGTVDWYWTRSVKRARDEAWSFIHRQIQKVWWLLMTMAVLVTFAMFFFGGGYMLCAAWLVILGLSLTIHGLFSEELLEWIGIVVILIGIGSLGAHLSYETMRWIAAAVFGIGLPLLALLLDRGRHRSMPYRLGQVLAWSAAVLALPLALQHLAYADPLPDGPVLSLDQFRRDGGGSGPAVVVLPAGTRVPVELELGGDLFAGDGAAAPVLPLVLREPVELLIRDGKLTGDARFPGEDWLRAREVRWISIPWLKADLLPERGPVVTGKLIVQLRQP